RHARLEIGSRDRARTGAEWHPCYPHLFGSLLTVRCFRRDASTELPPPDGPRNRPACGPRKSPLGLCHTGTWLFICVERDERVWGCWAWLPLVQLPVYSCLDRCALRKRAWVSRPAYVARASRRKNRWALPTPTVIQRRRPTSSLRR